MYWFASQRDPLHFAKPLINAKIGTHRFRVGNYRVIVELQKETSAILVIAIRHRSKAYE
jgi:mRNA interferase RelE/StbE